MEYGVQGASDHVHEHVEWEAPRESEVAWR